MRLLVSWVRDFVDVAASPEAIADCLGLRGFEVAAIEPLGENDAVIDFEVTANRPDCLGVLGFARELSAAYNVPLRPPSDETGARIALAPVTHGDSERLKVTIEDPELCPRYAAAVAEVTPTVTPGWMSNRLHAAGLRPISPFVDITNYVLMEFGHPMHAFDLAVLANGELRIRRARKGERIATLDGVERALDPDVLVIADGRRPQAVAGVMGGHDSEVSGPTRTVAFESACFQPASVRRTSKRLQLKTEASTRFERGADVSAPAVALQRALALMQQIGAGRLIGPIIDRYPIPRQPRAIHLRRERLALLLGLKVPDSDVVRILRRLGLETTSAADGWNVLAPTFRVDLLREVDLIEEVGRHYGFDRLEPAFPPMLAAAPPLDPRIPRDQLVRRAMTAAGLSEAVTFGLCEESAARLFVTVDEGPTVVPIANPLSAKFDALRPSLLPGLVDSVAHNRRHGIRDVALFEIGARFTSSLGETRGLAAAWTGLAEPQHWSGSARNVDFFDVKGLVERVCGVLAVDSVRFEPLKKPFLSDGAAAAVVSGKTPIGFVGQLSPAVADQRGAPRQDAIFVAELNLDLIATLPYAADERVQALPRHPSVVRDLSIVVADTLPAEIISGTIQAASAAGPAPLKAATFFDRYVGTGVPAGHVSLSVRLSFQAADRTLTDGDVQQSVDRILAALVKEHGAVQR
jgi:phenylalanyl-tRNA synthetase beta chain